MNNLQQYFNQFFLRLKPLKYIGLFITKVIEKGQLDFK